MLSCSSCKLPVATIDVVASVLMVLIPPVAMVVLRRTTRFQHEIDWASIAKMSDIFYMVFFFYVVIETDKFYTILCNTGKGTAIQCIELGCEVLWWEDPLSEDCQACKVHTAISDALMTPVCIVASFSAFMTAVTQNKKESANCYRICKWIHGVNAFVWHIVGFTVRLYQCECKWSWTLEVSTGFFGPLAALLLVCALVAEANWNRNKESVDQELEEMEPSQEPSSVPHGSEQQQANC